MTNKVSQGYMDGSNYPEDKNPEYFYITPQNQNPVFDDAVARHNSRTKSMFAAVLEVLVPFRLKYGLNNGWNDGWFEKIVVFFFAKPWSWLLLITIVCVFCIFIMSLTSAILGTWSSDDFGLTVFILSVVISAFCILYTGAAVIFWKDGWRYEKKHFMAAVNSFNKNESRSDTLKKDGIESRKRFMKDENHPVNMAMKNNINNTNDKNELLGGAIVEDCMNIETSIVSN